MIGYKWIVWMTFFAGSMVKLSAQSYIQFIENKGQWHQQIAFKGDIAAGSFILKRDGGFRVIQHNHKDLQAIAARYHGTSSPKSDNDGTSKMVEMASSKMPIEPSPINPSSLILHSHAYEVTFLNANPHPVTVPDKAIVTYNNYFIGNDPSKWASGCKIYQAVTYKNIYPNIDVRYYTNSTGQLKYDIIVNPGGDVGKIALYYDGVDALKIKDGALVVKNSINEVTEMAPESYVIAEAGRKSVDCSYDLKGNIVRFKMGSFSKSNILVIDPTEIFCSFSGSRADNWGYTATYDALGNFYSGGIVFAIGYQVTNGAYQKGFQGGNNATGEGGTDPNNGVSYDLNGFDIGVMKFNPSGSAVIYATYIGGANGNEQPHSLVVNSSGNLIIAGRTTSHDYPTKNAVTGLLSNVVGTGISASTSTDQDIVITELNATGTDIIGSIRIGGTGDDGVNVRTKDILPQGTLSLRRNYGDDARGEVIVDAGGYIYLVSCTQSSDFPTTNAFQTSNKGGGAFTLTGTVHNLNQDAVVLKISPDCSSVIFSSYLGGSGEDAAFALSLNPLTNDIYVAGATASIDFPGAVNTNSGKIDGFVAIIKNRATPSLVSSRYFGTDSTDLLYGIQFNATGNPFVMGTSEGVMPFFSSPFNTKEGQASGHQFIMKLSADLATTFYSVNFGNNAAITPNISPTAFLVDRCENVYVSGWGGGLNKNTDYTANSGTSGLVTKKAPDGSQPLKTTTDGADFYFFVLEKNAASQLYGGFFGQTNGNVDDHVDGGTSRFDKNGIIYQAICANCNGGATFPVTPGAAYTANGALAARNGFGCNLASLKIAFNLAGLASGLRSSINGVIRDTAGCVPLKVLFTDTVGAARQYIWDFGDGTQRDTTNVDTISHSFGNVGLYKVMLISIDSTSCNNSDTSYVNMKVRNDPATLGLSAVKLLPCTSFNYQFNNTSTGTKPFGNNSFRIDYGDGTSAIIGTGIIIPPHNYPTIGTYHVGLVLLDTNYCNQADTFALDLHIFPSLKAQFTTPALGCIPYNAVFTNTSLGGLQYKWDYGDVSPQDSTTSLVNVQHLYKNAGTYIIQLIANDSTTCNKADTARFTITTLGKPIPGFTVSPQPPLNNQAIIFTNTSSGGSSYKWLFGDGDTLVTTSYASVSHIYEASGIFNACLIVFNDAGCSDTLCQPVQALITPLFDVPNAFSPNGDGVNDMIFVKGFGIAKLQWNIYNRWGILVFQSTNKNTGWDGMYNGRMQPEDVYHYVLEVKMSDGTKYTKKGDITLLK
jgi:gliding motility-associated-like protein